MTTPIEDLVQDLNNPAQGVFSFATLPAALPPLRVVKLGDPAEAHYPSAEAQEKLLQLLAGADDLEWRVYDWMTQPLNLPAPKVIDFADLETQAAWSQNTFGPGMRVAGVLDHIRKELLEIEANPADLMEYVDVIILALDGAMRAGHRGQDIIDAYHAKVQKNFARTWPDWRTADPNKAIEHDRSMDA